MDRDTIVEIITGVIAWLGLFATVFMLFVIGGQPCGSVKIAVLRSDTPTVKGTAQKTIAVWGRCSETTITETMMYAPNVAVKKSQGYMKKARTMNGKIRPHARQG